MPRLRLAVLRRCRSRTVLLAFGGLYFLAMYVFHTNLQQPAEQHRLQPDEWANVGGDDEHFRRQVDSNRNHRELKLQNVFDDIRNNADDDNKLIVNLRDAFRLPANTSEKRRKFLRPLVGGKAPDKFSPSNIPPNCRDGDEQRYGSELEFVQISADAFAYAAYYDTRPNDFDNQFHGGIVRIMTVLRGKSRAPVECLFALPGKDNASRIASPVAYYEMCENHGKSYGGHILSCVVPEVIDDIPCSVELNALGAHDPVRLRIRTLKPVAQRHKFTICVPPLFGDVNVNQLVEFMEVSVVLGVEQVVFYDYKIKPNVRQVLDYYAGSRGLVEVLPWPLATDIDAGVWYHGQLVAIQDCLYRNMATSSYVVFNDIDEFIVPHKFSNWSDLVENIDRSNRSAFQFPSAFFDPARPSTDIAPKYPNITTLRALTRSPFSNIRTKCMVKPDMIFEAGIHHISKPIWAYLDVTRIDPSLAVLHHYRKCVGNMGMTCAESFLDDRMLDFENPISNAVLGTRSLLGTFISFDLEP